MRILLVLLALALAGCAQPAATVEPDAEAHVVVVPIACIKRASPYSARTSDCFEPSVAADHEGRLFVSNVRTTDLAVSRDAGRSWESLAGPPPPPGAWQSDVLLQVAPSGRLYYSAITLSGTASPLPESAAATSGVQVAWSDDAGATWTSTHLAQGDPSRPIVLPDRQWLGFAPDRAVYLTFSQADGAVTTRSDDGGATWTTWARVGGGPPLALDDQLVLVGECDYGPGVLRLHRSTDGGQTFSTTPLFDGGCAQYPVLAAAPEGDVVATWWDGADVKASVSRDAGASWNAPIVWAERAWIGAWPLVREDGTMDLAWLGGETPHVHVASGPYDGAPLVDRVVAGPIAGHPDLTPTGTDFAHAARLRDGRIVVPVALPSELHVVVVVPPQD